MIIPPCREIEPITMMEPINHNEYQEILGQDDTRFFYRGSLACQQASPRCGDSLT